MKNKILQGIKVVAFIALLATCIWRMSKLVERKDSDFKYKPFYEQKEDFDVLFMGTSHVINAVFPMDLWQQYGIVSYNFGGHGNMMPTTYWVMMNALNYTTPKLMVIDVLEVGREMKIPSTAEQVRLSLDSMPLSVTKYRAVMDLFAEDGYEEKEEKKAAEKWEYLFELAKYHSRWDDLSKEDFKKDYETVEKGAEMRLGVRPPDFYEVIPPGQMITENTLGMQYLRKMIEECRARGIEVLLTHLPYSAEPFHQESANAVYAIAEEYGIDYLNFVAADDVTDHVTDYYDDGHLNASGGHKLTERLGEYIKVNYDIPDRRNDRSYALWEQDYEEFHALKSKYISDEKDLQVELMLLADREYDSAVYIRDDSSFAGDDMISHLRTNLERVKGMSVKRGEAGTYYCFGEFAGHPEEYPLSYSTEDTVTEPDVLVLVFDSWTGELLQSAFWDIDENGQQRKLN